MLPTSTKTKSSLQSLTTNNIFFIFGLLNQDKSLQIFKNYEGVQIIIS